jgi:hypothetical protein
MGMRLLEGRSSKVLLQALGHAIDARHLIVFVDEFAKRSGPFVERFQRPVQEFRAELGRQRHLLGEAGLGGVHLAGQFWNVGHHGAEWGRRQRRLLPDADERYLWHQEDFLALGGQSWDECAQRYEAEHDVTVRHSISFLVDVS